MGLGSGSNSSSASAGVLEAPPMPASGHPLLGVLPENPGALLQFPGGHSLDSLVHTSALFSASLALLARSWGETGALLAWGVVCVLPARRVWLKGDAEHQPWCGGM